MTRWIAYGAQFSIEGKVWLGKKDTDTGVSFALGRDGKLEMAIGDRFEEKRYVFSAEEVASLRAFLHGGEKP